jgi:hypothetical protein
MELITEGLRCQKNVLQEFSSKSPLLPSLPVAASLLPPMFQTQVYNVLGSFFQ